MANILLVTTDTANIAYTRTKAALESQSHTVTGSLDTVAALNAAWSAGTFDLIATVRANQSGLTGWMTWVRDKWATGVPILIGGVESGSTNGASTHFAEHVGILDNAVTYSSGSTQGTYSPKLWVQAAHPITASFPVGSAPFVVSSTNWVVLDNLTTAARGVELGDLRQTSSVDYGVYMVAVDSGTALNTAGSIAPTTAPTRAVFCGWLYAGQNDYSADGRTILGQAVGWLAESPAPPAQIVIKGESFAVTATMLNGGQSVPIRVSGGSFGVTTTMRDGKISGAPIRVVGESFDVTTTVLDGTDTLGDEPLTAEPDAANRANGRTRSGISHAWVEYALDTLDTTPEPIRVMAQQMPTPTLVDGRPT